MLKNLRNIKLHKSVWQVALAVLMLVMSVYFIKNEHLELVQIKNTLKNINSFYVLLGLLVTGFFLLLQALMYVFSFRTIGLKVAAWDALILFLKRNLISVFLPAGGFSSLAFFTKPLKKKGLNNTDIFYASYIYGLSGLLSVILVAIPVIALLLLKNKLTSKELIPFLLLTFLILIIIYSVWSLIRRKFVYRLILRFQPGISILVDNIHTTQLNKKHFFYTLLTSVFVEFAGISHVYISMLALGFHPTILVSLIAYIIMVMLLIMSPFLRGMGAIEVSMTYVFVKSGIPVTGAAAITLVFRFFEFWMPLLIGLGSFLFSKKNVLSRVLPVFIIFISGIINLISAITPAIPDRIAILDKLLPQVAISVSNYSVFVVGVLLIILAVYLLRGVKRARRIALVLLAISVIGHLVKGIDYEEAIISFVAFFSLLITHRFYNIKSLPLFRTSWWTIWMVALTSLILYAVGATFFLNKTHMDFDYSFVESIKASFRLIFLFDSSHYIPVSHFARFFIASIYWCSGGLLLSAVLLIVKPMFYESTQSDENEVAHAKLLVKNYGNSALDYFNLINS